MKTLLCALALTTAITAPAAVAAAPLTFKATMQNYGGPGAYLALYVTDQSGAYQGTLWMAGGRSNYYRHLLGWMRASRGDLGQLRGITGASVGSGRTLTISFELKDAMLDAGYTLHIDAAVENRRESPSDVVVPLTRENLGKAISGKRFISKFIFE